MESRLLDRCIKLSKENAYLKSELKRERVWANKFEELYFEMVDEEKERIAQNKPRQ